MTNFHLLAVVPILPQEGLAVGDYIQVTHHDLRIQAISGNSEFDTKPDKPYFVGVVQGRHAPEGDEHSKECSCGCESVECPIASDGVVVKVIEGLHPSVYQVFQYIGDHYPSNPIIQVVKPNFVQ